jgi:serine O-acetyltransferase
MMRLMNFKHLVDDIDSMMARDPAARSRIEVVLAYPGFQALLFYRLAHAAWQRKWRLLGRIISHLGRFFTGIEIHPGATIGRRLFIDHGIGLVVGETAEIGDDVTLYQGITLGGTAPSVNSAAQVDKKRHPTVANRVIIGSGAQVLGPILVGEGARVGANAVVVSDVPAGVTVAGIPAKVIQPRSSSRGFMAYGTPTGDLPDPVSRAIEALMAEIARLQARIELLEHQRQDDPVPGERCGAEENGAAEDAPPTQRLAC